MFIIYYNVEKKPILAREGTEMNKNFVRVLCLVLAALMVLALVAMAIPMLVG